MKKHLFACAAAAVALFAQQSSPLDFSDASASGGAAGGWPAGARVSVAARTGYGFRMGGAAYAGSKFGESRVIGSDLLLKETTDHYLNYGEGIKAEISGSIDLMENMAAELSWLFTGKQPRTVIEYESPSEAWEETFRQLSYGAKLMLVPRVRLVDLIDVNFGMGIGLFFTWLRFTNSSPIWGQYEGFIRTNPSVGFVGRVEADYPVTDRVSLCAAVASEQISFTIRERRGTETATVYEARRNRSSMSGDVERPEKIPGSNVAVVVGVKVSLL